MTAEELLDVVDADDIVIGTATRSEVHRRGVRHRAVHILVYNSAGHVYVQRRSWTKDCSPGLWDTSAAGHVDHGETYAQAAQRELVEELGVASAEPLQALFALRAAPATGNEFVRVYRAFTHTPLIPDPLEIIDGRWLEPAALGHWLAREPDAFTRTFHVIWRQLSPTPTSS